MNCFVSEGMFDSVDFWLVFDWNFIYRKEIDKNHTNRISIPALNSTIRNRRVKQSAECGHSRASAWKRLSACRKHMQSRISLQGDERSSRVIMSGYLCRFRVRLNIKLKSCIKFRAYYI